jgi:hypothetical protein
MKTKTVWILGLVLILSIPFYCQTPEWYRTIQQIKLMGTTYDDVIHMLGTPIDGTAQKELSEYFDIKGGRIFVGFGSGKCIKDPSTGEPAGWRVPQWTVTSISFRPDKPISIKSLPFNTSGFHRYPVRDVRGAYTFEDDETGISFGLNRNKKVGEISFDPPKKYDNLRCR